MRRLARQLLSPDTFKIPESVLVVVYTAGHDILVMKRADLPDFWQSVTGSLDPGESPTDTAVRELFEETGLVAQHSTTETLEAYDAECQSLDGVKAGQERGVSSAGNLRLFNCRATNQYPIRSVWKRRYAPGTTHNTEHVFLLKLPCRLAISLSPTEHTAFEWLSLSAAIDTLSSPTNRAAVTRWVMPAS